MTRIFFFNKGEKIMGTIFMKIQFNFFQYKLVNNKFCYLKSTAEVIYENTLKNFELGNRASDTQQSQTFRFRDYIFFVLECIILSNNILLLIFAPLYTIGYFL